MNGKHANIPIFLPQLACPHRCIFCNQNHISSQDHIPTVEETDAIIQRNLATIPDDYDVQIAFFGGSFTGLPLDMQESYLHVAQPYIESGRVSGIRLSTRPDYIDDEILSMLKRYHVTDIELGAQSTNDEVLHLSGRGHARVAIENAAKKINEYGFSLGLQMMIGLPGDTYERAMQTAQDIVAFGAKTTRIYPTLVVSDTPLARLYTEGKYQALPLKTAVAWTKDLYLFFAKHNVTVLKVGLHPNKDFSSNKYLLAGPFHQSFKELVLSEIWHDVFSLLLQKNEPKENICIFVNPDEIPNAIGYNGSNKQELPKHFKSVQFKADKLLQGYEYTYCHY